MMDAYHWKPTRSDLFFSRQDSQDLRWGDFANQDKPTSVSDPATDPTTVGLWGYADDDGIARNGGRIGARYAPEMIRRFFYRLTPPLNLKPKSIGDFGDWLPRESFESQIATIAPVLAKRLHQHPMITLGGGHDYGAVDGSGFLQWAKDIQPSLRPLIINFDAHLDVRPWQNGLNSGTPFSWLHDHAPLPFEFIEVGIQKHCSSPHHHQWLLSRGAQIIDINYIHQVGLLNTLRQSLAGTSPEQLCYISCDIDVFSQFLAPGCSQSWDAGLGYNDVVESLRWLKAHKKVRLMGIYEVSPPLDLDHRTAKLAACLMDEFLR